eukprot:PITA_18577
MQGELMNLPGFRFHPTEEELLRFYLKKKVQGCHQVNLDIIIPTLDLYQYDPWELPGLAHGAWERQWFFFVPRDHKNSCRRPNRLAVSGYWKATGSDRPVRNDLLQCIGLKKILVFYRGKAPCGQKTDWIMNEYRMPDFRSSPGQKKKTDIVLCRIYRKAASQKSMEQRANLDYFRKEESAVSGDEYKEGSHSVTLNDSCQLSNSVTRDQVSSIHYNENQEGLCSSDPGKTNKEARLFECLEPIISSEETMVLKTPKTCKPAQLELPILSMDSFFSRSISTPYSLLPTPSPFHIPLL